MEIIILMLFLLITGCVLSLEGIKKRKREIALLVVSIAISFLVGEIILRSVLPFPKVLKYGWSPPENKTITHWVKDTLGIKG